MSARHRQVRGTLRSRERIRLPFAGKPVVEVLLDEDGRYYTDHPLLKGRFANHRQIGDKIRYLRDMLEFRNLPPPPPPPPVLMPPRPPPAPSVKLVDGAAESASALTRQEQDVSSLEMILDTTSAEVLSTWGKELVEADAESASGEALQDTVVASSKEESIAAGPQTAPHDTINGISSAFPSRCDKFLAGGTESTPTVTEQDDLDKLFSKLTIEWMTASPRTSPHHTTSSSQQSASSIGSNNILSRRPPNCFQTFYIRMDRRGFFCTYPNVGGPFYSVHEADDAIKRFLYELRHRERCKEQAAFSCGDQIKQDCKYFLDGPPIDPNSRRSKTSYHIERYLVEALLDQYNGDNNLFGDLAHLLEDLVRKQMIFENPRWFYHFNFTTKQKANGGTSSKLFFAEVSHMQGQKAWGVNCCRMINIEKNDGGGHCYGCKNKGDPFMQHPNDTSAFIGGHLDRRSPFCLRFTESDCDESSSDDDYGGDDGDDDDDDDDCSFHVEGTKQTRPRKVCTWIEHILGEL